jgi:hypothetical protein
MRENARAKAPPSPGRRPYRDRPSRRVRLPGLGPRGLGGDRTVRFERGAWFCDCPALIPRATHRPSAQQYVEQDDCDCHAECQKSNDHQSAACRGRRVSFDHPHRVRPGARTYCIVERNVGISDAAVSAHHRPSRAVVLFQDCDPSEPPEPTSSDVAQVGARDTGRTAATAHAHTRKVRDVRGVVCVVRWGPFSSRSKSRELSPEIGRDARSN